MKSRVRKMTSPVHRSAIVGLAVAVLLLAGCGGSNEPMARDRGPVTLLSTDFRENQSLALMFFRGGLTYGFYQSPFDAPNFPHFVYGGFFMTHIAEAGESVSHVGHEFNFDAGTKIPVRLREQSRSATGLIGTLESAHREDAIFASVASRDALSTDPSVLAGTYAVQVRSTLAREIATALVSHSGDLNLDLGNGCTLVASLVSRPSDVVYDVTATIGPCSFGSGEFKGHAIQNAQTRNLYVMLTSRAGDGVFLLLFPPPACWPDCGYKGGLSQVDAGISR